MILESDYNALLMRFYFVCGCYMAREDHIDDVNDGSAHCITKDDRWRLVG